jgi:AraC-like DNA-binding protein
MIVKQDYFQYITEGITPVNDGKNRIYYGELKEYFGKEAFRSFSIKLVLKGNIQYKTQSGQYNLMANSYLLTNKQEGTVIINSPTLVTGVFIDLQEETIIDAINIISNKGNNELDNLPIAYFGSANFFENTYNLKNTALDKVLKNLIKGIVNKDIALSEQTFLEIAEKVVLQERCHYTSLNNLKSVRVTTKKELLKRLLKGKEYMDDMFLKNPDISDIVGQCNMSSFHFFRSFKMAFGVTPYQYMFNKRLTHAKTLIAEGYSFSSIAHQCGFADIFSFSKAFKKQYQVAPSFYKSKKEKY